MEKKRPNGLTLVSGVIIIYSFLILLGNGISPGGSNLAAWAAIFSFISAIGIYKLKKWAWYSGVFFLILDIIFYIIGMWNLVLYKEYTFSVIYFTILPLLCIIYLINPKVREQFQ